MLDNLETPVLLLDEHRFERNIGRIRDHLTGWSDVTLRPHLKTAKCIDIARRVTRGPITVSTLKEAEVFAAAGYRDILYAVGITATKLPRVVRLANAGVAVQVILDNIETALAVAAFARHKGAPFEVLIEIDTDGHRGGLRPDDADLVRIGRILAGVGVLRGVLTHAGSSYAARSRDAIVACSRLECSGIVNAARILRDAGLPCPVVSMGSTPTVLLGEDFSGITEVRAGVYMFQDLVMAGIGVCSTHDIALSVLATVIGHRPDRGEVIVDAGWMAMSRDRGTQAQPVDQGYGLVLDAELEPIDDVIMSAANQEHGLLARRDGTPLDLRQFPVGTLVRILPNHACATAAQFDCYHVVSRGAKPRRWERFGGWA
jgi:D-serine deaminase-like pyridoxal phosphate-dependent protein